MADLHQSSKIRLAISPANIERAIARSTEVPPTDEFGRKVVRVKGLNMSVREVGLDPVKDFVDDVSGVLDNVGKHRDKQFYKQVLREVGRRVHQEFQDASSVSWIPIYGRQWYDEESDEDGEGDEGDEGDEEDDKEDEGDKEDDKEDEGDANDKDGEGDDPVTSENPAQS